MSDILFRNGQLLVCCGLLHQLSVTEISDPFCHSATTPPTIYPPTPQITPYSYNIFHTPLFFNITLVTGHPSYTKCSGSVSAVSVTFLVSGYGSGSFLFSAIHVSYNLVSFYMISFVTKEFTEVSYIFTNNGS